MKALIGVLNPPATARYSHNAGYTDYLCETFQAEPCKDPSQWHAYDELIITGGVNYRPGVYNIIGGVGDYQRMALEALLSFKGRVYCVEPFDVVDYAAKRGLPTQGLDTLDIKLADMPDFYRGCVIGDSHSLSVYPGEGWQNIRLDGKTLYSWLKVNHAYLDSYRSVIMYFGNIDIRFHLARQSEPLDAAKALAHRYVKQAKLYDAWLIEPLPIEDELRKIPNSGKYKGQPYFGDWYLRNKIRNAFCSVLHGYEKTIRWPKDIYNDLGELKFEAMEANQSVHLRPSYYMRELNNEYKRIVNGA